MDMHVLVLQRESAFDSISYTELGAFEELQNHNGLPTQPHVHFNLFLNNFLGLCSQMPLGIWIYTHWKQTTLTLQMHKTNTKSLSCTSVRTQTQNIFCSFNTSGSKLKWANNLREIAAWNTRTFLSQPYEAEIIQHAKSTVNLDHKEIKSIITMLETVII